MQVKKLKNTTFPLLAICSLFFSLTLTGCGKESKVDLFVPQENYGEMTLGEYKDLTGTLKVYTADDDEVDQQIQTLLYDKASTENVSRGAQEEDLLTLSLKATCDGENVLDYTDTTEDDPYQTYLGYSEFGTAFDDALLGKKAGETLSFSIIPDDECEYEELIGKTVDFDVTINTVSEEKVPPLDEQMIKELGYSSEDEMRSSIKIEIEEDQNTSFMQEAKYNLLQTAIDNSTFTSYTDDLYATCEDSVSQEYLGYMDMIGATNLEEVYEAFGVSNEDVKNEAILLAHQMMTINAIATEEKFELTQKEYDQELSDLATEFEYDNTDSLLADVGEDSVKYYLCEQKVLQFLYDNAKIAQEDTNYEKEAALSSQEMDEDFLSSEEDSLEDDSLEDDSLEEESLEEDFTDSLEDDDELDEDDTDDSDEDSDISNDSDEDDDDISGIDNNEDVDYTDDDSLLDEDSDDSDSTIESLDISTEESEDM